jgi:hypothetical protein
MLKKLEKLFLKELRKVTNCLALYVKEIEKTIFKRTSES